MILDSMSSEEVIKKYLKADEAIEEVCDRIFDRFKQSIKFPIGDSKYSLHSLQIEGVKYYFVLNVTRFTKKSWKYYICSTFTSILRDDGGRYLLEFRPVEGGLFNLIGYEYHFIKRYLEREEASIPIAEEDYINGFYKYVKSVGLLPTMSYLTDVDENLVYKIITKSSAGIALGYSAYFDNFKARLAGKIHYKTFIREDQQNELQKQLEDNDYYNSLINKNILTTLAGINTHIAGGVVWLAKEKAEQILKNRNKK